MPWQNRNKKKVILGLTGSFGSGKTTVARIFRSYGAQIIDADKLAHSFLKPGSRTYKKIISIFGENILRGKNRTVDREKLAKIVFTNKRLLKELNNIIHPQVISVIKNRIRTSKSKFIVLDVPLLIEAGLDKIVNKLIVVKITREKQIQRTQNKTSLSEADIFKRIKCQIPLYVKARLADFVIDNSGTKEETKKQVEQIRRMLWKN